MNEPTCRTCKFSTGWAFNAEDDADGDKLDFGACRRFPPSYPREVVTRTGLASERHEVQQFPPITSRMWCGEYDGRV